MEQFYKIIRDIKQKNFSSFYFLMGEEPYYIDKITTALLENVLTEEEKSFNLDIVYGKEIDVAQIISYARQFPMMAEYRLLVVKEAQDLKNIEDLSSYATNMQLQTIVVVNYKYKTIDKRKSLYKALSKNNAIVLEFPKLKESQISKFISQLVSEKNRKIGVKATAMLTEFLGTDLLKIENEIDKLCILINENEEITEDVIEKNIGISKDFNNFELVNAIAARDQAKAMKIGAYFSVNTKMYPPVVTVSVVYNFFSLLLKHLSILYKNKNISTDDIAKQLGKTSWQLKDTEMASKHYNMKQISRNINYLKELDLKLKGVNSSNVDYKDLMNEFLAKIFT